MIYGAKFIRGEDGWITVSFRDIPSALTQGATHEEAVECAVDALLTAMQFYVEKNKYIPFPPG